MTKYKDLPQDEKDFVDYLQMRWVRVMSFASLLGLGLWMILSPEKPDHASIEKGSVYLLKELWGLPLGIILFVPGIIGVVYFIKQWIDLKGFAFIKFTNGYYLFENKKRISGLSSIYNGNDLLVFHPEQKKVISMKNYSGVEFNRYFKAPVINDFSNDIIYWQATDEGYVIMQKGKHLKDSKSEYRGDDLIVTAPTIHSKLLLKNYKNSKDGKLRQATYL